MLMQPGSWPLIYVINLDRRPERWESAAGILRKNNMTRVERISAVDGRLIDSEQLPFLLHPEIQKNLGVEFGDSDKIISLGAVGCTLSHYKCWEQIAASGEPAIIAEDDLDLNSELVKAFDPGMLSTQDFVALGIIGKRNLKRDPNGPWFQPLCTKQGTYFFGTHFYYITPAAARYFMTKTFPLQYQTDCFLSRILWDAPSTLKASVLRQNLATQLLARTTDIQTTRSNVFRKYMVAILIGLGVLIALVVFCFVKKQQQQQPRN